MTSWYTSWLPSTLPVPSQFIPSDIQRRFVSFVLKRSLGHLLKPGQLDVEQIDSQIGGGYVTVRDLRIDEDAINASISDLPIRLHSGSIASVTARVPWPNPLTSTLGLSVHSPRLTFHFISQPPIGNQGPSSPRVNLAESVASVADSFIHEELSPPEEVALKESLHPESSASEALPGAFGSSHTPNSFIPPDNEPIGEGDPEGVGLFATLLERLLSRFEFDADDTKIRVLDEGNVSFTLNVPSVKYSTEEDNVKGEVRTVKIKGVTVHTKCLRPRNAAAYAEPPPSPLSTSMPSTNPHNHSGTASVSSSITIDRPSTPVQPQPQSPRSLARIIPPRSPSPSRNSDEETDEEVQMMMSQSIASLPTSRLSLHLQDKSGDTSPGVSASSASLVPQAPAVLKDSSDTEEARHCHEDMYLEDDGPFYHSDSYIQETGPTERQSPSRSLAPALISLPESVASLPSPGSQSPLSPMDLATSVMQRSLNDPNEASDTQARPSMSESHVEPDSTYNSLIGEEGHGTRASTAIAVSVETSTSASSLDRRSSSPSQSMFSSMYESAVSSRESRIDAPQETDKSIPSSAIVEDSRDSVSPTEPVPMVEQEQEDETDDDGDLLISLGSEPIVIQLRSLLVQSDPVIPPQGSSELSSTSAKAGEASAPQERRRERRSMQLSVSIGILACAVRAWQVRSVLNILSKLPGSTSVSAPEAVPPSSGVSFVDALDVKATMKGIIVLVLTSPRAESDLKMQAERLQDFFAKPLVPPRLSSGYVRTHLDTLSLTLTSSAMPAYGNKSSFGAKLGNLVKTARVSVSELSVFAFVHDEGSSELFASPICITDPNLPTQYSGPHVHPNPMASAQSLGLPMFDTVDWTDPKHRNGSAKLSAWRMKLPKRSYREPHDARSTASGLPSSPGRRRENATSPPIEKGHDGVAASTDAHFALHGIIKLPAGASQHTDVDIKLAPLHFFADLSLVSDGVLCFLDEMGDSVVPSAPASGVSKTGGRAQQDAGEDSDATPPATPHPIFDTLETERERERRRLEKLVIKDLDLEYDYGASNQARRSEASSRAKQAKGRASRTHRGNEAEKSSTAVTVHIPMIRLQMRCPPPPSHSPRSGVLIFDTHHLKFATGHCTPKSSAGGRTRFGSIDEPGLNEGLEGEILKIEWRRALIACGPRKDAKCRGVLSVGSLLASSLDAEAAGSPAAASAAEALLPSVRILAPQEPGYCKSSKGDVARVISMIIPSIYLKLDKSLWDGLQLWTDDVTQLLERASDREQMTRPKVGSNDASIIGSRYFAGQDSSISASMVTVSGRDKKGNAGKVHSGEIVFKVNISEAFARIELLRTVEGPNVMRPFDVSASDAEILVEVKPSGKDETVVTAGITNVSILDVSETGIQTSFLSFSGPRSLATMSTPMVKLRFTSLAVPGTVAKESKVKLNLGGFTFNAIPNYQWITDLAHFAKAPPGAFESVIPSERTCLSIKIRDGSIRVLAPNYPGALILWLGEIDFAIDLVGDSPETIFDSFVGDLAVLLLDDMSSVKERSETERSYESSKLNGVRCWQRAGYALLSEVSDLKLRFRQVREIALPQIELIVDGLVLRIHLCADTICAMTAFAEDLTSIFKKSANDNLPTTKAKQQTNRQEKSALKRSLMSSIDDHAFRRLPELGSAPDMIHDDLPSNPDYLDLSFGAAAGFRELTDEDLDEFSEADVPARLALSDSPPTTGIISSVGGETIKVLDPEGISIVEDYFETLPPEASDGSSGLGDVNICLRLRNNNVTLFLYEGYDWLKTRKTIEEEVKAMKRRLAKIRQLLADGQAYDSSVEETSTLLFNSVYVGLEPEVEELESSAMIAAIDEELREDVETATQSSWQSLKPQGSGQPPRKGTRSRTKRLTRAKAPSIEIRLCGVDVDLDQCQEGQPTASRILATVRDLEILDHIKTSTWKKFLSELLSDARGNVRETDSNMVKIELRQVHPDPNSTSEETRLRAKILPLRLHVDQDALDFLKKFFSFKDSNAPEPAAESSNDAYIQYAEIFPVDIKLDYKPRRVDYRALREGKTIELMNFFHFDGAEMTLRHLTLHGITGWPRFFDKLNDLWTPDVKATQMVDIISGVAPIRSFVNVGSGVADLVLLPIAQYKKDGRVIRGVQKGTSAFMRSTAMEAIKLGARLATGTQVILEQTENVLGAQFNESLTTEAFQMPISVGDDPVPDELDEEDKDQFSRYAEQPNDVKEGIQSAYKSLKKNLNSAAQTILAVPMEVYERSGNEGPVRAVIRAVPVAVLKPMIGASEAVSKTLLGIQNSLDPSVRQQNEAKYKQR